MSEAEESFQNSREDPCYRKDYGSFLYMPVGYIRRGITFRLRLDLKIVRADHADHFLNEHLGRTMFADIRMDLEFKIRKLEIS